MQDILISVIVPVYNVASYVERCLDSVINQTYKNIEIICIDDGSTDGSGKILDKYAEKDDRIKVIHQENKGLSAARNIGMDIASGKAVSFIDSDDWIAPDFYERLVSAMRQTKADVVQSGYYQVKADKKKKISCKNAELTTFEEVLSGQQKCYVWNKLWKKDFLNQNNIRFEPDVYYEDVLFTVQTALHIKKWVQTDYVGYFYCYNPVSITRDPKKDAKRSNDRFLVNSKSLAYAEEKNIENKDALKRFLIKHLIDVNELANKEIYEKYKALFSNHWKLKKKRIKSLLRCAFNISIKRKIQMLGRNLWK